MPLIDVPEPPRAVVLLCGMQNHGKTEVARWLARQWGFYRVSFADPIRAMLAAAGVPDAAFSRAAKNLPCAELGGQSARDAMETLGEWGRAMDPLFWGKAWERRIRLAGDPPQVVVDDARFDLETAHACAVARAKGAAVVVMHIDRAGWAAGTEHKSNRLPAVPDGVAVTRIVNDGDVVTLGERVDAALRERGCL